jgi:hypothetical protein
VVFFSQAKGLAPTLPYSIKGEDDIKKWVPLEEKVELWRLLLQPEENQVI